MLIRLQWKTSRLLLRRLKYKNIGILITDHNVNETLSICDRAYLLIEGKIFKHGTAEELADDEKVRRLYLGRNFELKRKDYLHEEAKKSSMLSLQDTITAVENAIEQMEQLSLTKRANEPALHFSNKTERNEEDEENLNGYALLISNLKNDLIEYADASGKKDINARAHQLMAHGHDLSEELQALLKILKDAAL